MPEARIWDVRLQMLSVKELLARACARLAGVTKLTREEMRLAGSRSRGGRTYPPFTTGSVETVSIAELLWLNWLGRIDLGQFSEPQQIT